VGQEGRIFNPSYEAPPGPQPCRGDDNGGKDTRTSSLPLSVKGRAARASYYTFENGITTVADRKGRLPIWPIFPFLRRRSLGGLGGEEPLQAAPRANSRRREKRKIFARLRSRQEGVAV
jgi:hypothetical protein